MSPNRQLHSKYLWISRGFFGLVCAAVATLACGRRVDPGLTRTNATASAAVSTSAAGPAIPVVERSASNEQESCGVEHSAPLRDGGERVVKDTKTGRDVTLVGQAVDKAAKRTNVADVMQKPEDIVGRTLLVEGEVTAMCTHRRAWYAIVDASTKQPLRIIAVPNFLVPANAMGKRARTAGVLEIQEVSEQAATHLSRDHGLPAARRIVTLRATGAEFM